MISQGANEINKSFNAGQRSQPILLTLNPKLSCESIVSLSGIKTSPQVSPCCKQSLLLETHGPHPR